MRSDPISGVVLAGGASRRLGQDKALLQVDGTTLLAHAVRTLMAVTDEVLVTGRIGLPDDATGATAVADAYPDHGPLGGLLTGLCRATHGWVAVVAVDLPFLEPAVLRRLAALRERAQAVVPLVDGRPQPLVALYHRSAAGVMRSRLENGAPRLSAVLDLLCTRWVPGEELREVDPALHGFTNINTQEEWTRAWTQLVRRGRDDHPSPWARYRLDSST